MGPIQRQAIPYRPQSSKGNHMKIEEVHLEILPLGTIHLDIKVEGKWRRVITGFHAVHTDYYVTARGLELGDEVFDVSSPYENNPKEMM